MNGIRAGWRHLLGTMVFCAFGLAGLTDARSYDIPSTDTRYDVGAHELDGRPGSILRVWPLAGGGPADMQAFRILYRSRGVRDEPIAVSAAIFFPKEPAPARDRPVIAWAHPTTGVATRCAPSLAENLQGSIQGFAEMARAGYVVVATDYEGLGTTGTHPYLIGSSEGRALLDSVRAAHELPNSGAGKRFALWGHSQGGHAVLFAGRLARSYAPELSLVGIAAAAPPTNLIAIFNAEKNTASGVYLSTLALWSWSRIFDQPLDKSVYASKLKAFEATASECIMDLGQWLATVKAEKPLRGGFFKINPTKTEPWRSIIERNSPGPTPPNIPVFLSQGTADDTVRPYITKAYLERLCRNGVPVRFKVMPHVGHVFAAQKSASAAVAWMSARFAGERPPNDCVR